MSTIRAGLTYGIRRKSRRIDRAIVKRLHASLDPASRRGGGQVGPLDPVTTRPLYEHEIDLLRQVETGRTRYGGHLGVGRVRTGSIANNLVEERRLQKLKDDGFITFSLHGEVMQPLSGPYVDLTARGREALAAFHGEMSTWRTRAAESRKKSEALTEQLRREALTEQLRREARSRRAPNRAGMSWKALAADYKKRAAAARKGGSFVEIDRTHGTALVHLSEGDERFYDDWQYDEFIDGMKKDAGKLLDYISIEDFIVASSVNW